ncbi:MAG: cysteine synthase A [Spirochaetales bacterium]|uniref:Cysteine synthase n=1 Tax=Candidatus Thalassospirochaeta sargassi TaxID=3119039 RepID=A0AAJ1MNM2_9SPIO|nr:cysteine synthase A [Spirochaetales bacterium]
MKASKVTGLIGGTPLVRINRIAGDNAEVWAKLEYFNPGGSVKDRIALALIEDGEKKGLIKPDTVIIEPTSGNTGIGLAMVCAVKGYRIILTMPETVSAERRKILAGFGAELVLTSGKGGMTPAIEKAKELAAEVPSSYIPGQFTNPANPGIHEMTTGPEIWESTGGRIDYFVAGVGTGGTLSGTGRALKKLNPQLKVIAAEPSGSPVISQHLEGKGPEPGAHKIQGIGAGFIPDNLDVSVIDEVLRIEDEDAREYARRLMKEEGLFTGISAGAAAKAASIIAARPENRGKTVVFVIPDTGERYLSAGLFD